MIALLAAALTLGMPAMPMPVRAAPAQAPFVPMMRAGDVVPDVPLVDQDGRSLSLRRPAGATVLSFVYTRCADPKMCPLVTAKFSRLQTLLHGTGFRLLEVTLDPEYDRPTVLRRYADAAGADRTSWMFATGAPADVLSLAERFGILLQRTGPAALAHSGAVAIVASDGTIERLIEGNTWSADDVAAAARDAAHLPSSPLRRVALALFARVAAACGVQGNGGLPLIAVLAIFIAVLAAAGWVVVRLFAELLRPTLPSNKRR